MDHDAELDASLEQVEVAGLVEQYDPRGRPAVRLTPEGVRVGRQLAMLGEDGQDPLMAALLGRLDCKDIHRATGLRHRYATIR
jgi:hypothetical protein